MAPRVTDPTPAATIFPFQPTVTQQSLARLLQMADVIELGVEGPRVQLLRREGSTVTGVVVRPGKLVYYRSSLDPSKGTGTDTQLCCDRVLCAGEVVTFLVGTYREAPIPADTIRMLYLQ